MSATMYGWLMVWPQPISSGWSSYALRCSSGGTNAWRGTARMAASTRGSWMPRPSICSRTMCSRRAASSEASGAAVGAHGPAPTSAMMTTPYDVHMRAPDPDHAGRRSVR